MQEEKIEHLEVVFVEYSCLEDKCKKKIKARECERAQFKKRGGVTWSEEEHWKSVEVSIKQDMIEKRNHPMKVMTTEHRA